MVGLSDSDIFATVEECKKGVGGGGGGRYGSKAEERARKAMNLPKNSCAVVAALDML